MSITFAKAGADLAKRVGKLSTAVKKGERDTLVKGGMAGKDEHVKVIRRDSGDMRLSGVGRRGARVNARFNLNPDSVEFKATGPLHFLANPMSPHKIGPKKRSRAKAIAIPGVGPRASAMHPGTSGKDTWNRATPDARRAVAEAFHDRQVNIIRRALG